MEKILLLLAIASLNIFSLKAQEKKTIFTVSAGYLCSFTKVTEPPGNSSTISQFYDKPDFTLVHSTKLPYLNDL